jgi:CO dehydrogenase maturation factor
MRIAFVGKGGAGKSTFSTLFSQYIATLTNKHTLLIDADLNMHAAKLVDIAWPIENEKHLSHPQAVKNIKSYLVGNNARISSLGSFRKTTPPATGSNILRIGSELPESIQSYFLGSGNLQVAVVGTYDEEDIGVSCYHANLSILEIMLSHMTDQDAYVVVDMVAGVDAFANTLHAQFDALVLAVEPTQRGVEVFRQYSGLAQAAGVLDRLLVVGNKVRGEEDAVFLATAIPQKHFIGSMQDSNYLRKKDREGGKLDVTGLEPENIAVLEEIRRKSAALVENPNKRLKLLQEIHRKYASQPAVQQEFGNLLEQIDENFSF